MIFTAHFDHKAHEVKIIEDKGGFLITIDKRESFHIDVTEKEAGGYAFIYKGRPYEFDVENKETTYNILHRGKLYSLELVHQKSLTKAKETGEKKLISQMPGKIIQMMVKPGDTVSKGQGLLIMEAMKMENELKAPTAGIVKSIHVKIGQTVDTGANLIVIE